MIENSINSLKHLVRNGEHQTLELKLKTNHPEKIIREIVAFSNSQGGILLIGISDDRQIVGLKHVDEDEYILNKFIEKNISPSIDFTLEKIKIGPELWVLKYTINESKLKPHFVLKDVEKKAYIRVADRSIQASKELREILKNQNLNKSFKFTFGQKESILMLFLSETPEITISKFAEIAEIPKKLASRTLVLLVLSGVLGIRPHEQEDLYFRKN